MACLSVSREGSSSLVVAANPIYLTSSVPENSGTFTFEVLDADMSLLDTLVGEPNFFALGSEFAAWGVLRELSPIVSSTVPGLALLRHRQAYSGRIEVLGDSTAPQ